MKANEILAALNLNRNRETLSYCTSLAKIFTFLSSIKSNITDCEIVESDLSISDKGKLFSFKEITRQYQNKLLDHYEYQDKELQELKKEMWEYNDLHRDKLNLKTKEQKKNKNTDLLEIEIKELLQKFNDKNDAIQNLLKIETQKISDSVFTIEEMRKELELFKGVRIYVCINQNNGIYSFTLPIENKFYNEVCSLLNIACIEPLKEEKRAVRKITIDSVIINEIKKAAKFVSFDELRPVFQGICLHFENNSCEVVATDAHKLFISEAIKCDSGEETFELVIAPESIKKASSIKSCLEIDIEVYEDSICIDNVEINILKDVRYPKYKDVVPAYSHSINFNRTRVMQAVKEVKVYANKCSNQVNLYMNGQIEISAQDIDFSFEAKRRVEYLSKDFEDTTMGFNGNFFNMCLQNFKEENIEMQTDGQPTKGVIFTNKKDRVLLMPLMINA